MAFLLKKFWFSYGFLFEELADPKTMSWPLVAKPYQGLFILAVYVSFVLKWGPEWMKNRRPYNIDKLLIIYNLLQVVVCSYVLYEFLVYAWLWHYQWICEPIDYSDNPRSLRVAEAIYHYHLLKYLDLADTIFFVLRKKPNQASFLHLFHHTGMILVSWGCITYLPGGHSTFIGLINSFVHVVMYSYYLLTVFDPAAKQSLWWKKYLTLLQMAQIAICCVHTGMTLVTTNCGYPLWVAPLTIPSDIFLLCLFTDFYVKNYIAPKRSQVQVKNQ